MQQIPIAGSIIDQMDTFETAKRKSMVKLTRRTYSILMITVKPALCSLNQSGFKLRLQAEGDKVHDSQSEQGSNNYLGFTIHLQIPNDENRQDAKNQIGGGSEDGIRGRDVLYRGSGETLPNLSGELQPEIADRIALHDDEDEVDKCEEGDGRHGDLDDPEVQFPDADSQEVEAD